MLFRSKNIIIDTKQNIDKYLEITQQNNLNITHIAETHIHADYLSGSLELAAVTGGDLYLSDEGGEDWQYEFPHIGLKDKDVDRKSTRLNSSHVAISYAVFCLKKKKQNI